MKSLTLPEISHERNTTVSSTCVIGLQWGDEAKGKLVDLLAPQFDIVVRYLGGANAGHTVVCGGKTYKLHHIPSGILHSGVVNVVAAGVVVHPPKILQEIAFLRDQGVRVTRDNLRLSERAHLVCPWHIAEDRLASAGDVEGENIGTTLRGIGPCYRDKVGRTHAIRLGDLLREDLTERVSRILDAKRAMLPGLDVEGASDPGEIVQEFAGYAELLSPHIGDTTEYLLDALEEGHRLLFEGAQGALLDLDHGTYPFVTSSNSSGVGVSAGSGVPARWLTRVVGVLKSYATRVGGGPFPTELNDATGQKIRERGREYGTTTGRPRRCGWFDAVAARYAARLSGVGELAVMMLDVLSDFDEVKICVGYEVDGKTVQRFPADVDRLRSVRPVYQSLPGWHVDVSGIRSWDALPERARDYVQRIAQLVGTPVRIISVGPDREQTIFCEPQNAPAPV